MQKKTLTPEKKAQKVPQPIKKKKQATEKKYKKALWCF